MATAAAALDSVVENTSGKSRWFQFLAPGGVRLASGQKYTVPGDVMAVVYAGRDGGVRGRTRLSALQAALDSGALTILQRPSPILLDSETGQGQMLTLASGVLGTTDPGYFDSQVED